MPVYLDTNFFVAVIEGQEELHRACRSLLELDEKRVGLLVTSELTLAEVLAAPHLALSLDDQFRVASNSPAAVYSELLLDRPGLSVQPIDRPILLLAALWRVKEQAVRLPDAIHLATAAMMKCDRVVSGDRKLRPSNIHTFTRIDVSAESVESLVAELQ